MPDSQRDSVPPRGAVKARPLQVPCAAAVCVDDNCLCRLLTNVSQSGCHLYPPPGMLVSCIARSLSTHGAPRIAVQLRSRLTCLQRHELAVSHPKDLGSSEKNDDQSKRVVIGFAPAVDRTGCHQSILAPLSVGIQSRSIEPPRHRARLRKQNRCSAQRNG